MKQLNIDNDVIDYTLMKRNSHSGKFNKTMKLYEEKIKSLIISQQHCAISHTKIGSIFLDEQKGYHILKTTLKLTIT
jgi:hypothetical protein